jgi:glycosyltransferase involved in cell wall biosynthesis
MLSGSGSNIYVQNIARALDKLGHEVHVICQERQAERFPFVSRVVMHYAEGENDEKSIQSNGITVHVPDIGDTLPVFVWDNYPTFKKVIEFPKMSFGVLQQYLDRNVHTIREIVQEQELEILHANHAIMMPLVARLVGESTPIPYVVALHGSALVYAVQEDPTLFDQAVRGLEDASSVLVGNQYFKSRVLEIFAERYPSLENKIIEVPLGVDTEIFKPIPRASRKTAITRMIDEYKEQFIGRDAEQSRLIRQEGYNWIAKGEIPSTVFDFVEKYSQKHPDADLQHRLLEIDWEKPVLLYVGRLILGKGIQDLLVSYFEVLKQTECQLIIVGSGPIREWLEIFVILRQHGINAMIEPWFEIGFSRDTSKGLLDAIEIWLQESTHSLDTLSNAKVIFTGFLDHSLLHYLLPCTDIAVFPSVVPESFGLVALEAASAGVIPLVTDFSGLRDSALVFEKSIQELEDGNLRFPLESDLRIKIMVEKINHALTISTSQTLSQALRETCQKVYSWDAVTASLVKVYESVKG